MDKKLRIVLSLLLAIIIWVITFKFFAVLGVAAIVVILIGIPVAYVAWVIYMLIS